MAYLETHLMNLLPMWTLSKEEYLWFLKREPTCVCERVTNLSHIIGLGYGYHCPSCFRFWHLVCAGANLHSIKTVPRYALILKHTKPT